VSLVWAVSSAGIKIFNVTTSGQKQLRLINLTVSVLILVLTIGLTNVLGQFLFLSSPLRFIVAVIVVAIPGLFMGIPFPAGLSILRQKASAAVPWAWSINTTATVIGTISAVMLAMSFGFTLVLLAAALLYAFAGIVGTSI
jgi:hypothetical protein